MQACADFFVRRHFDVNFLGEERISARQIAWDGVPPGIASIDDEAAFYCRNKGVSISRQITFALAVADLLKLPDDLPLLPAVTAAMSVPARLSDSGSIANLRAVAHAAAHAALVNANKRSSSRPIPPIEPVIQPSFDDIKSLGGSSHYRNDETGRKPD